MAKINGELIPSSDRNFTTHDDWPKIGEVYQILFAVDLHGEGWLVETPDCFQSVISEIGSAGLEPCQFTEWPEEPGFYMGEVKFSYDPGDGWTREPEFRFDVEKFVKLTNADIRRGLDISTGAIADNEAASAICQNVDSEPVSGDNDCRPDETL